MDEKMELMQKVNTFAVTKDVHKAMNLPVAPNGNVDENNAIEEALNNEKLPDKKETKRIKKRFRNIWNDHRSNVFDTLDAENYKNYCEIKKQTAETEKELLRIQFETDKLKAEHWLEMHKGNLEEIGYNTTSLPNKYFYAVDRYIFYLKNRCKNIPKLTWWILCGVLGVGVVILMALGIARLF